MAGSKERFPWVQIELSYKVMMYWKRMRMPMKRGMLIKMMGSYAINLVA